MCCLSFELWLLNAFSSSYSNISRHCSCYNLCPCVIPTTITPLSEMSFTSLSGCSFPQKMTGLWERWVRCPTFCFSLIAPGQKVTWHVSVLLKQKLEDFNPRNINMKTISTLPRGQPSMIFISYNQQFPALDGFMELIRSSRWWETHLEHQLNEFQVFSDPIRDEFREVWSSWCIREWFSFCNK